MSLRVVITEEPPTSPATPVAIAPVAAPVCDGCAAKVESGWDRLCASVGPKLIENAHDIYDLFAASAQDQRQESFLIVMSDVHSRLMPKGIVEVAKGQRSAVNVGIEDIVREVVTLNPSHFVAVHWHPSGLSKPSPADRALTKTIEAAFSDKTKIDCQFVGHVIIGHREYFSIFDNKRFKRSA